MNQYRVELKSNINILNIFAESSEDIPEILKERYCVDESNIRDIKLVRVASKPGINPKCEGCDD
jgi:hypothetical protein